MSLTIEKINTGKTSNDEYILLKANDTIESADIYAIVDNTYDAKGTLTNVHRHFFRFLPVKIEKNEHVYLYTCEGKYRKSDNEGIHYFYMNYKNEYIWNNPDAAELFNLNFLLRYPIEK